MTAISTQVAKGIKLIKKQWRQRTGEMLTTNIGQEKEMCRGQKIK
jgi:hypothetical protein